MSENSGEKTFAPTQKRKDDAAKKGDVLRSKELGTAVGVFAGALWLRFAGPWLMNSLESVARSGLSFRSDAIAHFDASRILIDAIIVVLVPIVSLGVIVMIATVLSQLLFGDGRFVPGNLAFKSSRLNPIKGLGRIFGPNGLIELGKSLLKIVLLGSIAWCWGAVYFAEVIGLGRGELTGQLAAAWTLVTGLLMVLAVGLALIAAVDFPIQWVRRMGRLKMSHQDMRDEHKTQEGSPEKRAAIRNKQRQLAMGGVA
ncbi:MAG: EscU/YscU/HrcU family type III secretion system export apparatus switch protein, partial [Pontixanthobacter sp.]